MTAGLNLKGRVWRMYTQGRDDDQGGAVPSGTVVYDNIHARISAHQPTLALLEQGLQVPEIFEGIVLYPAFNITGTFDIRENDQLEITWPPINPHYQKKFVIIGRQYQSFNDNRRYVNIKLRRLEFANSNSLQ